MASQGIICSRRETCACALKAVGNQLESPSAHAGVSAQLITLWEQWHSARLCGALPATASTAGRLAIHGKAARAETLS